MEVNELAAWLMAHDHADVTVLGDERVESTFYGKRRAYVFVPPVMSYDNLLGDVEHTGYWKRVPA